MAKKKYTTSSGIKLLKKASKTTLNNLLKLAEIKYNESLKLNKGRTTAAKQYIKVLKAYESKYKRKSSKASIQLKRLEITKEEHRIQVRNKIQQKIVETEDKYEAEFRAQKKAEGLKKGEITKKVKEHFKRTWKTEFKLSNTQRTYDRLRAHYERTEEDRIMIEKIVRKLDEMDWKLIDSKLKEAGIWRTYYDSDSEAVEDELNSTTLEQIYDIIAGSRAVQKED